MHSIPYGERNTAGFLLKIFLCLLLLSYPSAALANNVEVGKVIAKLFSDSEAKTGVAEVDANYDRVRAFYESRTFKPVWTRDNGPKGKGKALLAELKRSGVHGLSPEFYNVSRIEGLMDATQPEKLAELDMLLSGAMIAFADDLSNGHIGPEKKDSANAVPRVFVPPDQVISEAADAGNFRSFAKDFLNVDDRYFRLIAKLIEFDRIEAAGLWPKVDANGKEIKAGSSDQRMKAIRQILLLSGTIDPAAAVDNIKHDEVTGAAIRIFQRRHGLEPTGDINRQTLAEMAVPISVRKQQILLNLERRRWQNRELGEDHVYINMADNSARIVLNGKKQADISLAVRGRSQALPTFYGNITGFLIGQGDGFNIRLLIEKQDVELPVDDAAGIFLRRSDLKTLGILLGKVDISVSQPGDIIRLEQPLEVFVTYLTAWANKDGSINYRPDPFNRDQALAQLLRLE